MTDQSITDSGVVLESAFEHIKQVDPEGNEYWTGRELMYVLGYATWQRIIPAYQEIYSSLCLWTNQSEVS